MTHTLCKDCNVKLDVSSKLIDDCGHNFVCEICANKTQIICETCGQTSCNGECCKCKFCVKRRQQNND